MFIPLLIFVAILVIPLVIAFFLQRQIQIDTTVPCGRISASYWGKYEGQPDAPCTGTIVLHDATDDENAPTPINLPSRAVAWHP